MFLFIYIGLLLCISRIPSSLVSYFSIILLLFAKIHLGLAYRRNILFSLLPDLDQS